jgi:hypothetical protein
MKTLDKDDLWIMEQFLQDDIDKLVREFEDKTNTKVTEVKVLRIGLKREFCSRISIIK